MKKLALLTPIIFSLSSCAELSSLANTLQSQTLPDYEFYEKFSETANKNIILPIIEKNLTTISDNGVNEKVFSFSPFLVNKETFAWYSPDDSYNFNNKIWYFNEIKNNNVLSVKLGFSHVLNFTRSNFYKIFDINQSDITINQLKKYCESYRRIMPLYKLTMKNGKSLYIAEYMGTGSLGSSSDLYIFRTLPTCKNLGFEKTVNAYGNEFFDK